MFSVLTKLGWFFKEYWKRYTVAVLLLIIANVFEVIPPMVIGSAIDSIFLNTFTNDKFILYVGMLLIGAILNYFVTFKWQYNLFGGAFIVEKTLRSKLMNHLLKMSPIFYEKNKTGDLMARATNDLKSVSVTAGFGILTLVDSTLYMFTILLTMGFLVSWQLTIAAVIPLPLLAITMKILGDKIHKHYMVAQDAFGDMNDGVLESVAGVRVIRAYNQERAEEKRFAETTEDVFKKNMIVEKIDAYFHPISRILTGLSYCIGLSYGTYLVFQQQITLGELVAFNVYLGMLTWPMFAIGELINVMQRGNASLDRVQETLDYQDDVPNQEKLKTIDELSNVEFSKLNFQYPSSNVKNLESLSLQINRGETIGIVGKTGSGKTTLIKQLLREYPLGSGNLKLAGVSIEQQAKEDVRDWIGYVPQDQFLFSRSVKENILFGKEDASDEDLEKAMELADFKKDLDILPNGLQTLVGEKGVALSGGQKQRISIARALIKNPELLILDDALSAVDAKTEAKIIQNLKQEREGKTTIITTHRLSAVEHAHWIVVLDEGKIIEEGTHQDLVENNGWYKEQFDRQQIQQPDKEEVEI
ncbi:ABC transporter ATP-binding protein/permease [Caldibacillus lycopersici]|uniref:ABC transporter ATP-binding protein/permease n=1 Tax=Perspicuibacillus lycopersici TaxID=1325689 RepID=A0AAE3IUB4_9BACI|nr:ABC transporter ATP-binding protein [Perspicuibacillus lycopersici]MCU9613566.1 ABC transporter ATP-binding protein/permease [Perspicuibacillus lycopersici]